MATILRDTRFGFRLLRKNPGFAALGIFVLALGIGANTAIFSIHSIHLRRVVSGAGGAYDARDRRPKPQIPNMLLGRRRPICEFDSSV
ncbi:MAG: hypothetical protein WB869_05990 [Candidatus Acidiferrales bacterium]